MALTFKQKMVFALVAAGTLPAVILTGITTWRQTQQVILDEEHALESIAAEKAAAVTDRITFMRNQVETSANSPYILEAYEAYLAAIEAYEPTPEQINMAGLEQRYAYQAENTSGATLQDAKRWTPRDDLSRGLQTAYIANNSFDIGAKEKLDQADDGSVYSLYHGKYHPYMRDVLEKFGFYDIFFIEPTQGRVVYSVFKEVDFMMPLFDGPYENTNFARAAKRAMNEDRLVIEDFEFYEPSYGAAASFVASPIRKDGKVVGAYVAQIPAPSDLFAKSDVEDFPTKESFLISGSGEMRTDSIRVEESTIGQKIDTEVLAQAKERSHGYLEEINFHGNEALVGFHTLDLPGLDWIAISTVESDDVMSRIYGLIIQIALMLVVLQLAVVLLGIYLSKTLLKPVEEISDSFNHSSESLSVATNQIGGAVKGMMDASQSAMTSSETVRESSGEAARNVAAVASAVEELNISINDISRSITESNTLIDQAVEQAQQTDDVVRKLGEAGARISDVIKLINDLAEQTNLLALNAAIEAARAGDAGRGFAVVADEVKKLASHTSEATSDITDQVKSIQSVSDESVNALRSVMDAIHQIRDSSTTVSAAVEEQGSVTQEIAASVQEAANRVDLVDQNMGNVEGANQETSSASGQVSTALEGMENEFRQMNEALSASLAKMGLKK